MYSHQIHSRLEEDQAKEFVNITLGILERNPGKDGLLKASDVPVTELHRQSSMKVRSPDTGVSVSLEGVQGLGFDAEEAVQHLNGIWDLVEVESIFTCLHSLYVVLTVEPNEAVNECGRKLEGWTKTIIAANEKKDDYIKRLLSTPKEGEER